MTFDFPTTPEARLIVGGPKTGKTQELVEHAARLVKAGVSPRDIEVFVASPNAIDPTKARLSQALPELSDVQVRTVRHLVMEVLSTPEARELTGRNPRVLDEYETSFLMEDMKGTGIRPKRLKGMLGFFFRCYAELENLDSTWLQLKEEEEAHERLTFLLSSLKAYLEPELSNAAYRVLSSDARIIEQYRIPHILVDDYQTLSRASQVIANLVAEESICIAGDAYECVKAFESHPYAAGMDEFAAAMPHAQRDEATNTYLGCERLSAIQTLFAHGSLSLEHDRATGRAPESSADCDSLFEIAECLDPESEAAWALEWVQKLMEDGMDVDDIVITVPNPTWERRMGRLLSQAGVPVCLEGALRPVGGDIRYSDSCRPAQVLCLLALAADPHDEPSLRAWCGFGEYLTNAQIIYEIRQQCAQTGKAFWKALSDIASDPRFSDGEERIAAKDDMASEPAPFRFMSEITSVVSAYRALQEMLDELAGLDGFGLIERAVELVYGEKRPRLPLNLVDALSIAKKGDSAILLYEKMTKRRLYPCTPNDRGVRIMSMAAACGVQAEAALVMGAVNGFTPSHQAFDEVSIAPDRAEVMRSCASRGLVVAIGLARRFTAVTYFTELAYREAEKLDLKVERIYLRDGLRRAKVAKTILLEK